MLGCLMIFLCLLLAAALAVLAVFGGLLRLISRPFAKPVTAPADPVPAEIIEIESMVIRSDDRSEEKSTAAIERR